MSEAIRQELMRGDVVDITTRGRRTGEARRIEIRLAPVMRSGNVDAGTSPAAGSVAGDS